jgi:hypothetical protein
VHLDWDVIGENTECFPDPIPRYASAYRKNLRRERMDAFASVSVIQRFQQVGLQHEIRLRDKFRLGGEMH